MGVSRTVRSTLWLFALALQSAVHAQDGTPATIPLEVLEPDPAIARGEVAIGFDMFRGAVPLALQPARIARGVVVERRSGKTEVLALALLGTPEKSADGRLNLDPPRDRQAWCQLSSSVLTTMMTGVEIPECYQDQDGDGAFETEYTGRKASDVGITIFSIDRPKARSPLKFRAAQTEELPLFHVGYLSCGRAEEKSAADVVDLRYGTYLRSVTGGNAISVCNDVATLLETRDGEKIYRVGRFTIAVHEKEGVLETRMLEGIPAGTLLANLRFNRPLLDAAEPAPTIGTAEKPSLFLDSIPQTASTARIGEVFFEARVAHGITGRLRNDVKVRGWGARIAYPAGTAAFGVPMTQSVLGGETEPAMTWCVPSRDEKKKLETYCFTGPGAQQVIQSFTPFMVEHLYGTPRGSEAPIVMRGPVEFEGPLLLQLRLSRIKGDYIVLDSSVSYAGEPVWWGLRAQIRDDGKANVLVGGAVLRIQPGADGKSASVEVSGTFQPGEFAIPTDVRFTTQSNR